MKRLSSLIFFIYFAIPLTCQEPGNNFSGEGELFLDVKTISFVKNNEYFNPVTEGYTLIGSFIRPQLVYAPSEKFEIGAGVHQQIYAGAPGAKKPLLLFSARWKPSENTLLTLGSFNGSTSHRLPDPLFDTERIYTSFTENGISFVTEKNTIFTDTWINWENFIFRGDTTREIFTAGESFIFTSPLIAGFMKITLPLQVKFKHYGGQISNYPGHVLTFFNMAGGTRFDFPGRDSQYGTPGFEYLHFIYRELTAKGDAGITEGHASWIRLHYRYRNLYLGSYFWISDNFFSPDGNQIYSSVSDYQPGVIIPRRKIWTGSASLTLKPYNLFEMVAGFEGYYDFRLKRMDNTIFLHINFDSRLKLATVKKD